MDETSWLPSLVNGQLKLPDRQLHYCFLDLRQLQRENAIFHFSRNFVLIDRAGKTEAPGIVTDVVFRIEYPRPAETAGDRETQPPSPGKRKHGPHRRQKVVTYPEGVSIRLMGGNGPWLVV